MLFVADVGNSSVAFGVMDSDGKAVFGSRVEAVRSKSADEYAVLFSEILRLHGFDAREVADAILCSVVPPLTRTVSRAIRTLFGVCPIEIGAGVKTGLNIRIDVQTQLGADLVANAVAALADGIRPTVIADLGTATTLTVITREGILDGVIIAPGLRVSLDALAEYGAELPDVSVKPPKRLIGKNTQDSMRSGVLYGHAAMLDGLIERIREETDERNLRVIATGGLAEAVLPYCREKMEYRRDLTLEGLYRIWQKNRK